MMVKTNTIHNFIRSLPRGSNCVIANDKEAFKELKNVIIQQKKCIGRHFLLDKGF